MAKLPEYVKKAAMSGRSIISGMDNPRRKVTDNIRSFIVEDKYFDDNPDYTGNVEVPWIYEINEVEGVDNHVIATFTFSTGIYDAMYKKLKALGEFD